MGRFDRQPVRFVGSKYSNLSHTKDHLVWDPTKLPPGPENICFVFYNESGEEVTFESFHPLKHLMTFAGLTPEQWSKVVCPDDDFVFLPHQMYIGSTKSGRPIKGLRKFGDAMFDGSKLPSRPETKKIRVFR